MMTLRTHKRPDKYATMLFVNQACPICRKPLVSDGKFVYCSGEDSDGDACPYFADIKQSEDQCSG